MALPGETPMHKLHLTGSGGKSEPPAGPGRMSTGGLCGCQWHGEQGSGSSGGAVPCCHTPWDMGAMHRPAKAQTGEGSAAGTGL